ncbi:hypothetical protein B0H17DRAFT_1226999 [Mycena rosella]|uniref:Uncharacterized protein n=1 Tax=Mycena rosella TaxID=1033263 RepID=A0AAD7B1S0_MYCRO|nr:hypothetical protein B0H17DRAFT_1226999 [Mycena rosella]
MVFAGSVVAIMRRSDARIGATVTLSLPEDCNSEAVELWNKQCEFLREISVKDAEDAGVETAAVWGDEAVITTTIPSLAINIAYSSIPQWGYTSPRVDGLDISEGEDISISCCLRRHERISGGILEMCPESLHDWVDIVSLMASAYKIPRTVADPTTGAGFDMYTLALTIGTVLSVEKCDEAFVFILGPPCFNQELADHFYRESHGLIEMVWLHHNFALSVEEIKAFRTGLVVTSIQVIVDKDRIGSAQELKDLTMGDYLVYSGSIRKIRIQGEASPSRSRPSLELTFVQRVVSYIHQFSGCKN